jgi:hypothetical protein
VLLGVIAFPAVLLAWQWLRDRSSTTRFNATGPVGTAINMAVFFALVLTPYGCFVLSPVDNIESRLGRKPSG